MSIGARIKEVRKEKGLTQKQLGEILGVTQQVIGRYETDQRKPKIDTLEKIGKALDISVHYLLYGCKSFSEDSFTYKDLGDSERKMLSIMLNTEEQRREFVSHHINDMHEKKKISTILDLYNQLNDDGKEKVQEYITDLLQIEKYRKNDH